jgi:hypothetical protein
MATAASSPAAPLDAASALAAATAFLGGAVRLTLSDARVLTGRLHCLDWKGNVILRDAALVRPPPAESSHWPVVAVALGDVTLVEADAAAWAAALAGTQSAAAVR